MGKGYIGFGVANPALYRLMFGQALPSADGLPEALMRAVGVARGALRDVILTGARDGSFRVDAHDDAQLTTAAVSAWSLVHGLTLLTIDQVVQRDVGAEPIDDLGGRVVDLFVLGLQAGT